MKASFPAVLVLTLLAGCAGREDGISTTTNDAPYEPLPIAGSNFETSEIESVVSKFQLTDCIAAAASVDWWGDLGPGTAPPSWERTLGTDGLGSSELIQLMLCHRVSWGQFERPMGLVLEAHSKIQPPESCRRGESSLWLLANVWTTDAEFSTFLAQEFGLQTYTTSLEVAFENSSADHRATWTWGLEGLPSSSLSIYSLAANAQAVPLKSWTRFAWPSASVLHVMDYNETATVPDAPEQLAQGTLAPPTLHSTTGLEAFAGTADWILRADAAGSITSYGDFLCTKPL